MNHGGTAMHNNHSFALKHQTQFFSCGTDLLVLFDLRTTRSTTIVLPSKLNFTHYDQLIIDQLVKVYRQPLKHSPNSVVPQLSLY